MKASDIPDIAVLAAVVSLEDQGYMISRWDIAGRLLDNEGPLYGPDPFLNVVNAKLRALVKAGLLDGCVNHRCNCRGDFEARF